MLKQYLDEIKTLRSFETFKTYSALLLPFEKWLMENNKSLTNCTYTDVYAYLKEHDKWSMRTCSMVIVVIKNYFTWYRNKIPMGATTEDLKIAFSDKQRADQLVEMAIPSYLKREEEKKKMALDMNELEELLDMIDVRSHYVCIYLLAYFGLRKSELAAINKNKGKDIDFKGRFVKIRTAKTYAIRKIYFSQYVGSLLKEFLKIKITSTAFFNNMINIYARKMNIRIFPHAFRHTFVTQMTGCLKDIPHSDTIIKTLSGHTLSDMTQKYTEITDEELKDAMIKFHYMNKISVQ